MIAFAGIAACLAFGAWLITGSAELTLVVFFGVMSVLQQVPRK